MRIIGWMTCVGLLVLAACTKKISKTSDVEDWDDRKLAAWWQNLEREEFPIQTVSYKARMGIDSEALTIQVSFQSHLIKDSTLWASISKFGIETHRILLTPDSIKIMDRLSKTAMYGGTQSWLEEQGMHLTFSDLQRLWIGRHPILPDMRPQIHMDSLHQISVSYSEATPVAHHYVANPEGLIHSMQFKNAKNQVDISQESFDQSSGWMIPVNRRYRTSGEDAYILDLEIKELKINEAKNLSFRVPDKYEVVYL